MSYYVATHGELDIHALPALESNYIWVIVHRHTHHAVVVDPGDAHIVMDWLAQQSPALTLAAIIITHHHHDHTGGIAELVTQAPNLTVHGPHDVTATTHSWHDGDQFDVLDHQVTVMETPAHTLDHCCYLITPKENSAKPILFTGDTLFMAGCGRLFEGTAEQMLHNMERLAALPSEVAVYAGHEYTLSNLAFALAVEPDNTAIQAAKVRASAARDEGRATLPSTIGQECLINPFMRTHEAAVVHAVRHHTHQPALEHPVEILAALRHWKDTF